ncbi:MAG: UDP-N-acetylmuramate--L-alanine ligase [Acidimicrobiales bacterium]
MSSAKLDLSAAHHIHIVGAGGAGMNAIASVLASMGQTVTGSDLKDSAGLDRLRSLGVRTWVGHAANQIQGAQYLAVSTAIPANNPEVLAAREAGIPVLRRAEILAAISSCTHTVAVSGTHGKTTTSSMLALMLIEAGMQPSFIIGGDLHEIGSGAVWDTGDVFVVEADESDGTFIELGAEHVLVTNVEADHLDYYGTFDALRQSFVKFVSEAPGTRVICADDLHASEIASEYSATTYGFSENADVRISSYEPRGNGSRFLVSIDDGPPVKMDLAVPGRHNALNATGALSLALAVGADLDAARRALDRYAGVGRRFEFRGDINGITFVDDYAHLPTEVRAALSAAKDGQWRRVIAVFQPHRFSRTANVWRDFADSFTQADHTLLMGIYPAGESAVPGITGKLIVDAVKGFDPETPLDYCENLPEAEEFLAQFLEPGDLCITLGAGDVTLLPDRVQQRIASFGGRQ